MLVAKLLRATLHKATAGTALQAGRLYRIHMSIVTRVAEGGIRTVAIMAHALFARMAGTALVQVALT